MRKYDEMNALSLGLIEQRKEKSNSQVKYKILYKDYNGKEHKTWTNWMRDDGYKVGDSIPVRSIAVPSFGLVNLPVAIDNNPQTFLAPYILGVIVGCASTLFLGYQLGKNKE